ncbi:MAG: DNA cytosine methyltransferase [Ignavibacteria bacterium]|nr:DNA cytosine methyltransferase [Ignavibacteria bacterium]
MEIIGIDLFSGAGGMSVGAELSGVNVKYALDIDKNALMTYKMNHKNTEVFHTDIRGFKASKNLNFNKNDIKIVFGGPPCQGFSSSNQKTRNKDNILNWLFIEFLRICKEINPEWIIIENVKGIIETSNGFFFEHILNSISKIGYTASYGVLNAADFSVPQIRNRVFIVASKDGIKYELPKPKKRKLITVSDAISDLPILNNGDNYFELEYKNKPCNEYQRLLRKGSKKSFNNLVTKNKELTIKRFGYIPQGGNFKYIPKRLMKNYKDISICHTGIYHRLNLDKPSIVIGNYRKNMLIHPTENRGLSVREAARIQSFPDKFHFYGSIGCQQQQVGNSVPPLLSKEVFNNIIKLYL